MLWLHKNNYLNKEGKDIMKMKIGEEFSITSDILTFEGNLLMFKFMMNG